MKLALAVLFLCGVILTVDARCDAGACSLGSPKTGPEACATYDKWIHCLEDEEEGCTSSDPVNKVAINAELLTAKAGKAALAEDCSGAGGLTVSVFSLFLSLVVAYFKP